MTASDTQRIEVAEIIGSTVFPEEDILPLQLAPIIRIAGEPDVYFLPEDESDRPSAWSRTPRAWIDEEFNAGTMFRIEPPIAWRDGHDLLQVDMRAQPEYVPTERLQARLSEIGRDALVRAAQHLARDERAVASDWAWTALRALPDEPVAALAVICLERSTLPESGLAELTADLRRFKTHDLESSVAKYCGDEQVASLIAEIVVDPAYRAATSTPGYLSSYPANPGFISASRRAWQAA